MATLPGLWCACALRCQVLQSWTEFAQYNMCFPISATFTQSCSSRLSRQRFKLNRLNARAKEMICKDLTFLVQKMQHFRQAHGSTQNHVQLVHVASGIACSMLVLFLVLCQQSSSNDRFNRAIFTNHR